MRHAARSLLVDRSALVAVDGLRFCRHVFVGGKKHEGFTIGVVDPRRQMAMCIWENEASLERFLTNSAIGRAR